MTSAELIVPAELTSDDAYCIHWHLSAIDGTNIRAGDYLVIQPADTAPAGALVLAEFDGKATVLRWAEGDGLTLLGRVVGLYRVLS